MNNNRIRNIVDKNKQGFMEEKVINVVKGYQYMW